jgi:DHA1 family bicyclomycin/chloramphenicol resistance-like MFS transporter
VTRPPSTVALVLLTGVGPFATDMYLAGLPELRQSLHTNATMAQLTLTAFIVGLAAGQFFLGPISDARGRRGLLLSGAVAFTVLSAACAVAPTAEVLVAARLGEGIAAGSGVVIGRAVVTDTHHGAAAAAKFGTLASITFLAPIMAPALGGIVLTHGTWRAVFATLAAFGLAMVVAVLAGIPETLPASDRQSPRFRDIGARMSDLLRDWSFLKHVTVYWLSAAGFFTYIGGSAFVLQSALGISQSLYAVVFTTNAGAMAVTAVVFRALVPRLGAQSLRTVGVTVSTLAAVGLLLTALAETRTTIPLALPWGLLCTVVAGTGLTVPATTALAQEAGRRSAGTAASLQGGLGFFIGALVTPLTGSIGYDSLLPMASAMAVFYLAAFTLMLAIGWCSPAGRPVDAGGSGSVREEVADPTVR